MDERATLPAGAGPEVEHVTDDTRRSGSLRERVPELAVPALTSLSFTTVRTLMSAARALKEQGFDVLAAPRRIAACGVVIVLDTGQVSAALTFLDSLGIKPDSVGAYSPNGGGL
jgi:hypothetical protein